MVSKVLLNLYLIIINYNTIINYILITYELSNFDYVLGVVSHTKVSGENLTHDPHANSVAHYPINHQGNLKSKLFHLNPIDLHIYAGRSQVYQ